MATTTIDSKTARPPEGCIVLNDMSWEFYERFLEEFDEQRLPHSYVDGELRILSPVRLHNASWEFYGKLLEELGWNENDMKKFTQRLRNNLREDKESETPQSKAGRLQFQEWLKNIDLKSKGRKRTAGDLPKREFDAGQGRRTPPPAEYRDLFEAYTRGLNRRIENQPKKKQK